MGGIEDIKDREIKEMKEREEKGGMTLCPKSVTY